MTIQRAKLPDNSNEQFYSQVSESIKLIFDLTSRIDERVKMVMSKQGELYAKFDKVMEGVANINSRISVLESRDVVGLAKDLDALERKVSIMESQAAGLDHVKQEIEEIESKIHALELKGEGLGIFKASTEDRWKTIFDTVWKIGVALITAYLLIRFGLK